jgi:hypothetical protein
MDAYAIIRVEADCAAIEDRVLAHFNEHMQQKSHALSFVTERDGYFRVECSGKAGASSAAIEEFGNFLVSSGYWISGISSAKSAEGSEGTEVKFTRQDGTTESVVLSTLNVY